MAENYQDIPVADREKAKTFFNRARAVAGTGNFDYSIEMYIQGLSIDPENLEAHMELRDISLKRKASGGKALGFMDRMKYKTSNKDDKLNMLNAEMLLANDPGNTDYMEALIQNAHRAGCFDTVMWIGPILQKANADTKKPDFSKFIVLKDVYKALAVDVITPPKLRPELFKRATNACHYAAKMRPDDMDLQTELKNLGAEQTMTEGGYIEGGSFRDSIKDRDNQEKLLAQDKGVQDLGVMGKLINDAEAQYRADPNEPGKLSRLVDALVKTEHPDYENKAIELLTEWHQRTKQFRFRKRIGEIHMHQWSRMERSQREYLDQNKADADAANAYEEFKRDKADFELSEYQLWAANYPTEMQWKYLAAERLFDLKKFDEAIPMLQQAETDAKYKTRARLFLGRSFYELKFLDEAIDTLDALIKEYQLRGDELSKEMHYWCGRAYQDRGDRDAALKLYSAIVRMEFNYRDVQKRIRELRQQGGNAPQSQ